jgi:hypothetical protein
MGGTALGWTLLVCVTALGLGHLAVAGSQWDYRVARALTLFTSILIFIVSPVVGTLLLLAVGGTDRLRLTASFPATVPRRWAGLDA